MGGSSAQLRFVTEFEHNTFEGGVNHVTRKETPSRYQAFGVVFVAVREARPYACEGVLEWDRL